MGKSSSNESSWLDKNLLVRLFFADPSISPSLMYTLTSLLVPENTETSRPPTS
jgi:hypothetical protein